jgi:hydroxymethylpyrimidine/phosphomethylpyrimidine kinase
VAPRTPTALTIAGSDSGGGAGIQADLKAFASCGVHGTSAITAVTAQNTLEVRAVAPVAPEIVLEQVRAVVSDIGVDAVKVGMLGDLQTARAVEQALSELPSGTPVVVDPVMVAESGARLIEPDAERMLAEKILPLATVATPNLLEARVLAGVSPRQGEESRRSRGVDPCGSSPRAPRRWCSPGPPRAGQRPVPRPRRAGGDRGRAPPGGATHGSGCTHSAVLAAQLAPGTRPAGGGAGGPRARRGRSPLVAADLGAGRPVDGSVFPTARPVSLAGPVLAIIRGAMSCAQKPGTAILAREGDWSRCPRRRREPIEAFRRELDDGMWAAVPTHDGGGTEAEMVKSFDEVSGDAERVIFFPRAAGGSTPASR